MKTVKGGHYQCGAFGHYRNGYRVCAGDGKNAVCIFHVYFLPFVEEVNDELAGTVKLFLGTGCFPCDNRSCHGIFGHLHILGFARGFLVNECHQRLQGWCGVIDLLQDGAIVARIVDTCSGIPLTRALYVGKGTLKVVLDEHLMGVGIGGVNSLNGALDVLTDEEWALTAIVVPPIDEHFIVCCLGSQIPIDLGYVVVYPTLFHPIDDVGIEVVVVLCA